METDPTLDDWVLSFAKKAKPKVCFVPTAGGDATHQISRFYESFPASRATATHLTLFRRTVVDLKSFVLEQDVVYVGGGSTANLLAVWRLHGLPKILTAAWEAGVILAGVSAGAMCWFEGGLTDSFGPLTPIGNGLALLPGSFCPHYRQEPNRRDELRKQIAAKALPAGYAADDGAAIRFAGRALAEAVTTREGAGAFSITETAESPIPARRL